MEAPGTAPGSATLIPRGVYRHSRLPDRTNIRAFWRRCERRHPAALAPSDQRKTRSCPIVRDQTRTSRHDAHPEQQAEIDGSAAARAATVRAPTVPALEEILYQALPVLDHGFVRVIDYMGDDAAVVQAARVSYGRGTRKVSEDAA